MPLKSSSDSSAAAGGAGAGAGAGGASSGASSQVLAVREQGVFKQLVRFYETKQYKKALKAADTILRRSATHGETLAMKGLVYNQLKRSEEAHALVKRGLAANFNSHVCWHVYGLIYRSENQYEQAIKCFDERTQLLAHDGHNFRWMGLDDIQQHLTQRCTPTQPRLLFASYDPSTSQLEYQPLSHPPLVKLGRHSMVDVRQQADDAAASATAAECCIGAELSVTDDHTLFVELDDGGDSATAAAADCTGSAHYRRVEARALLGVQPGGRVRLLAAASGGASLTGLTQSPQPQPCQRMQLAERPQCQADRTSRAHCS